MAKSVTNSMTRSRLKLGKGLGLLALRLTFGGLMMGHGAQKVFGWFGGGGINGTAGWLESLGMRPGKAWAWLAGMSEFGGGLLTALGFLNPIGPLAAFGAMAMATVKAHLGKPIWASKGGAELPLTNLAIATALMSQGPGFFSLDRLFGIRLPRWLAIPGLAAALAAVAYGYYGSQFPALQAKVRGLLQSATQTAQQASSQVAQQVQQVRQGTRSAATSETQTAANSASRTQAPSANGATAAGAGTSGPTSFTPRP